MRKLFVTLMCVAVFPATAATKVEEFAFSATLDTSTNELQKIELPLDVVLAVTKPDLRDVAVFNVDGKPLPHAVMKAPRTRVDRSIELPFHEFSHFQSRHSRTVTTREQNRDAGTELETTETVAVQSVRKDYLIELKPGDFNWTIDRIDLRWEHEPAEQLLEVRIETGNDIDNLRTFKSRKRLTNLESDDADWRGIDNLPRKIKYLRIKPVGDVSRFEIQSVVGHYREIEDAPTATYRFQPERIEEENRSLYTFEFPSRVPSRLMRIVPSDRHSVIQVDSWALWPRVEERTQIHFGVRQHNIDGSEVKPSSPMTLSQRNIERIWFAPRSELTSPPTVELIYPQYEVLFLGDGNGPYTLAWGNHEAGQEASDLRGLLQDDLNVARLRAASVSVTAIQESGGAERLAPQPVLPWQKWLLWALLVGAAILTGLMAIRLYREMNHAAV